MDEIPFDRRVRIPAHVLVQEIRGELIMLDLAGERYYSLNAVGGRIWEMLKKSPSIQVTYEQLLQEYAVDPERMRADLHQLVKNILDAGLGELVDADTV
jgi:hypothetical protein